MATKPICSNEPSSKCCKSCEREKPLAEFRASPGRFGRNARCIPCERLHNRLTRKRVDEARREYLHRYNRANIERKRQLLRDWRSINPERSREITNAWRRKNPDKANRTTPAKRMKKAVARGIGRAVRDGSKAGRRTFEVLGYSAEDLMVHLEKQFTQGMTWENYGNSGWHIDHIIPSSSFQYETPDDPAFKACWALTNLRPLWAKDNLSKGARRLLLI